MDQSEKIRAAQAFIEDLPHTRALGLKVVEIGEGVVTMSMPYDEKLIGDPGTGVIHGGAVSALMDSCAGAAVLSHPAAPRMTATIDLRIDYMRAATPGQTIRATATCHHMTRSVAFVRTIAVDDDADHPVAAATGAFSVGQA